MFKLNQKVLVQAKVSSASHRLNKRICTINYIGETHRKGYVRLREEVDGEGGVWFDEIRLINLKTILPLP